jgi:ABC-type nitrate/sulfonate/bicarbonate transport system permease component
MATAQASSRDVSALTIRWLVVVGFFVFVEIAIHLGWINQYLVPFPSQIVVALYRVVVAENVLTYFAITLGEVLAASAGLVLIGIPFGVLLARHADLWKAWGDWVAGFAAAPVVLLYPLFLVVFGRSPLTIIMIGLVTGLPPVVMKTVEGVLGVRKVLLNVGRSFNLSEWQQFWKIVVPAALPSIFLGLRLGLIYTMITIVAVEYLITLGGLGSLVGELAERYDLAGTYAAVCFVVGVSILFFAFLERLEKWLRLSV